MKPELDIGLETERLVCCRPRLADAPALFSFLGDADAMRHTQVDRTLRACRRRIALHERQRRRVGVAPWTVRLKDSGAIVGWGGLYEDPFDPGWGVELAFFFHPDVHGQGYGSEFACAVTDHADRTLRLPRIAAFASPDNTASRRLLDKTGFVEIRFLPAMRRFYFERAGPAADRPGR